MKNLLLKARSSEKTISNPKKSTPHHKTSKSDTTKSNSGMKPKPIEVNFNGVDLLARRIYSLTLGYEDLNDQNSLRNDPALLASIKHHTEQEEPLGSPPTLSRLENRIASDELAKLSKIFANY